MKWITYRPVALERTTRILRVGSCPAEHSGHGITVTIRVTEYYAKVEGQAVDEMFCLVADTLDIREYSGSELAALCTWRWDGSETALRGAGASLNGAGPGTGPGRPLKDEELYLKFSLNVAHISDNKSAKNLWNEIFQLTGQASPQSEMRPLGEQDHAMSQFGPRNTEVTP